MDVLVTQQLGRLHSNDAAPVQLLHHRVQDIDTQDDWERAEWLFKAMRQNRHRQ